jgi:hypothetical protein
MYLGLCESAQAVKRIAHAAVGERLFLRPRLADAPSLGRCESFLILQQGGFVVPLALEHLSEIKVNVHPLVLGDIRAKLVLTV